MEKFCDDVEAAMQKNKPQFSVVTGALKIGIKNVGMTAVGQFEQRQRL